MFQILSSGCNVNVTNKWCIFKLSCSRKYMRHWFAYGNKWFNFKFMTTSASSTSNSCKGRESWERERFETLFLVNGRFVPWSPVTKGENWKGWERRQDEWWPKSAEMVIWWYFHEVNLLSVVEMEWKELQRNLLSELSVRSVILKEKRIFTGCSFYKTYS